jgi:hypothetical protein
MLPSATYYKKREILMKKQSPNITEGALKIQQVRSLLTIIQRKNKTFAASLYNQSDV